MSCDDQISTILPYPCPLYSTLHYTISYIKLTHAVSIAYWIAFGPHGPRAQDPPGSGARVAWGVALGLGASFALFGIVRFFGRPSPHTMTQEYQEQTNEFLIVRPILHFYQKMPSISRICLLTLDPITEPKVRPLHRSYLRQLQGQGHGPVSSRGEIECFRSVFSFVLEVGVTMEACRCV